MAERRPPLPPPRGNTPSADQTWKELLRLWEYVTAGHDGLPAPHVHVGGDGTVVDPSTGGGGPDRMFTYFSMGS